MSDITDEYAMLLEAMENHPKRDEFQDSLEKNAASLRDSFSNSVLGIGEADHLAQFNEYGFENTTLNWFIWLALYNQSWVFRRVIDKPSQDMIRPGISIQGTADFTPVYSELQVLKKPLISSLKWSKLFGGSVMVLLFKGISFQQMEDPIDWKKIRGCRYVKAYVTDRWFGCAPSYDDVVSNLSNPDFGLPKYYDITFSDGSTHRIHHSWVIRFENRGAPNLIKTGQLQGWGYAEGAHLIHELSRDEKLKNSIQSLVDKSLIEVIQMPGMRGVFMGADKGNEEQLKKRLEMVNWARNFNSLTFLDKDDQYQQHQFSGIAGLSDILQQNMWQIAAAVEMPGILFGDLSNGFSHDNDALERYDEKIQNDCDDYLRQPMEKLLRILFHVYDIRDEEGKTLVPLFTFNSIIPEEKNKNLLTDFSQLLEVCNSLTDKNLMTAEQEASTLQEYLNSGTVNLQLITPKKTLVKNVEKAAEESGEDEDMGDLSIGSNRLMPGRSENELLEGGSPDADENTQEEGETAPSEPENTQNLAEAEERRTGRI